MARSGFPKFTIARVLSLLVAFIYSNTLFGEVNARCDIQSAQIELNSLKIDAGPADGIWGKSTEAAVMEFQSRKGISETGSLDPDTCDALGVMKIEAPSRSCESVLKEWTTNDMAKIAAAWRMTPETAKAMGIKAPAVVPPDDCSMLMEGSRVTPHCNGKPITYNSCRYP